MAISTYFLVQIIMGLQGNCMDYISVPFVPLAVAGGNSMLQTSISICKVINQPQCPKPLGEMGEPPLQSPHHAGLGITPEVKPHALYVSYN